MSHNDDNTRRSAWRHRPAIIGIIVALGLAALALLVFGWMGSGEDIEPGREHAPGSQTESTPAPGAAGVATDPASAPATN